MNRYVVSFILGLSFWGFQARIAVATEVPLGFHLLDPHEIELILPYGKSIESMYVTVPMSIYDRRKGVWENFFEIANGAKIIPIIRWVTKFEGGNWQVPSRKDVVEASKFASSLDWPGERIVVLFNEPNHAVEWGGRVDPEGYAELALFATNWLKTEKVKYVVLPAGLDNDAPTNKTMMDSFVYIERMHSARPELFQVIDAWTSHSYPNPSFSGTVYAGGKNSIRGFQIELDRLLLITGRSFEVYITETGWKANQTTLRRLPTYYREAISDIWVDERIRAVTLFVLKGMNGPFAEFSLLDANNHPTAQMQALQLALDGK